MVHELILVRIYENNINLMVHDLISFQTYETTSI